MQRTYVAHPGFERFTIARFPRRDACIRKRPARKDRRGPYRINSSGGIGRGWKRGKALRPRRDRGFVPPTGRIAVLICPAYAPMRRREPGQQALWYARCKCVHAACTISWSNGSEASRLALLQILLINAKRKRVGTIGPMTISGAVFARAVYSRINPLERNGVSNFIDRHLLAWARR